MSVTIKSKIYIENVKSRLETS